MLSSIRFEWNGGVYSFITRKEHHIPCGNHNCDGILVYKNGTLKCKKCNEQNWTPQNKRFSKWHNPAVARQTAYSPVSQEDKVFYEERKWPKTKERKS